MTFKPGEPQAEGVESPEAQAQEELLSLGITPIPENIQTVLLLQETPQHPEGYEEITQNLGGTIEEVSRAMRKNRIRHIVHAEGPDLWTHCKFAMRMVDFMPIPDEKKADLKLILLYHDRGKASPELAQDDEIREIQQRELGKGKLYKVAKGHAGEGLPETEAGFKANGISGRKLEVFMAVVRNHMENQLAEMGGSRLVSLFDSLGRNEGERKEAAELLALAVQADGNATSHVQFTDRSDLGIVFKDNRTGLKFEEIWARYLDAKK